MTKKKPAIPTNNPLVEFQNRYGVPSPEEGSVRFVREILGAVPDPWQEVVLRAYGRQERGISVRSCHGVGKTTVAAWCVIHQILTRFPQKTVLTAPTSSQLFDALWAEVNKWMDRLPDQLRVLLEAKADRIELLIKPKESFVSARTSRAEKPEAMQGVHDAYVLLIADEASGVPEPIFEAASGSMSGINCTTLLCSNPVKSSGFFYDTHHKLKPHWVTVHVSAADSPRVSQEYVDDMARRYGENSSAYFIRVLGEFPRADDDTIIPMDLTETALRRDVDMIQNPSISWGVDVARFGGDKSALCKRHGNVVPEPVRTWRNLDTMQLTGAIKAEYDACDFKERPTEILVDVIGIGAGVVDRLRELGLPCRGINVSESPSMGEHYMNLRAELWFKAKQWLAARDCRLPDDSQDIKPGERGLTDELISVRYEFASSGKIKVEAKDAMKKRGFDSPDRADAFVLTFAGTAATGIHGGRKNWGKAIKRGLKGISNVGYRKVS